jgi:hypothetical protein
VSTTFPETDCLFDNDNIEIPTFLLAGHESTRYGLYLFSQYIVNFSVVVLL